MNVKCRFEECDFRWTGIRREKIGEVNLLALKVICGLFSEKCTTHWWLKGKFLRNGNVSDIYSHGRQILHTKLDRPLSQCLQPVSCFCNNFNPALRLEQGHWNESRQVVLSISKVLLEPIAESVSSWPAKGFMSDVSDLHSLTLYDGV